MATTESGGRNRQTDADVMLYSLPDRTPQIHPRSFVAPSADVIGAVTLDAEASVWFGAVLRADNDAISVGAASNIQDGSVVHVDPGVPVTVGAGVTVGHSVMLHGCAIGDGSLVGIGSRILNGAVVGKNCIVGAHTLITEGKNFADGVMILGSPGKVVRELSDEEINNLRYFADVYVKKISLYRKLKNITNDS